jgi:hypothetical protein
MRKPVLVLLSALAVLAAPGSVAVAASPTLRATLVHTLRGCHVWAIAGKADAPSAAVTVKRGTRLAIRISCPMDFDVTKVRGPALTLGGRRLYAGTTRTIVFRARGTYVLRARNVQTPAQVGLQTLGADNTPTITVVVR